MESTFTDYIIIASIQIKVKDLDRETYHNTDQLISSLYPIYNTNFFNKIKTWKASYETLMINAFHSQV